MAASEKIAKAPVQQSSVPSLLKAALAYAAPGLAVFPLVPRTKEPATKRGFYDATTTPMTRVYAANQVAAPPKVTNRFFFRFDLSSVRAPPNRSIADDAAPTRRQSRTNTRRAINRASWQYARHFRGPSLSCAEWAMVLTGRAVALSPDDQRRREALHQDAHVLAALVHEGEILKRDAVDRILNAGVAFGIAESAIYEILDSEFMA